MASISHHGRISPGYPSSGCHSPRKDQLHPKFACGPLNHVHPFLTNSKCIEGRHASVVRRRAKSWNLRESRSRNSRDLHLEAIQREKSSRKQSAMPALQLRIASGDSSLQKIKKKNRSSLLFFGKADHIADSPSSTSPSDQLPPLFTLDNSSFLDLFQDEKRRPEASTVYKCQRASTMPGSLMRPVGSSARGDHNFGLSPLSPESPIKHPWSPNGAYANVNQLSTTAKTCSPSAARSLSASSRSSDAHNSGHYFSSSASQSSQSSLEEGNVLPSPCATRNPKPKPKPKPSLALTEQVCNLEVVPTSDLEVVQTSNLEVVPTNPNRNHFGKRTFSEPPSRNKPLPSEPLVDIASPFFEIACPTVRPAPSQHFSTLATNQPGNSRPRRTSSLSKRGRPKSPNLSRLSRGERLGLALTLHAQGMKIPHIVRHELPTARCESEEQSPESSNSSPISKLISEIEIGSSRDLASSHNARSSIPQSAIQPASRRRRDLAGTATQTADRVKPDGAETIILNILSLLDIHDLLSAARISKGFHGVFKRHQLLLTKSAILNTCPAASEYLEESGKGSRAPADYLGSYKNGVETISSLRSMLLIRCDGLLRQETVSGLVRADKDISKNIDQAFWRIWTFCEVFGYKSIRRDNSLAQVDWLRSNRTKGITCLPSTIKSGPLSLADLLDINEIWTCLATLLEGFQHQPAQAREGGLFERCNIDDTHTEEFYIKQWTSHVMTFGLAAILELSSCSFEDARTAGWTRWLPVAEANEQPAFLSEAVASAYRSLLIEEAEVAAANISLPRKASGRARVPRRRSSGHGDVLRIQTQNLTRKAVGSPARKSSIALSRQSSSSPPSHLDSNSSVSEGRHSATIIPRAQNAARRRSAASPAITASMFQALSLQPGASTQIGPTLFPSMSPSSCPSSQPTQPRPITPLSSIQSSPIALTQPERVPPRVPGLATRPEQPTRAPPVPHVSSEHAVVSPTVDPVDKAIDLLVNDMGFSPAAVKDALASCGTASPLDLDTVIAMIVSASGKPTTTPTPAAATRTPTVKLVQPSELDSWPVKGGKDTQQLQTRTPPPEASRLTSKRLEKKSKSAYSAQSKLVDFVGGSRTKEQKRQSKMKAFSVLGVTPGRRMSTIRLI